MSNSKFLEVIVHYKADGTQIPLAIIWKDGRKFEIDKITSVCKASSLKSGGRGVRYSCRIRNKEFNLFRDEDKWFIG